MSIVHKGPTETSRHLGVHACSARGSTHGTTAGSGSEFVTAVFSTFGSHAAISRHSACPVKSQQHAAAQDSLLGVPWITSEMDGILNDRQKLNFLSNGGGGGLGEVDQFSQESSLINFVCQGRAAISVNLT